VRSIANLPLRVHNHQQIYFNARILLQQKLFNQTSSLYPPAPPALSLSPPVLLSNRERIFAGRSPAVISWPGNVELR
jgi:hypothetical protein